jgi:hypothetical protein
MPWPKPPLIRRFQFTVFTNSTAWPTLKELLRADVAASVDDVGLVTLTGDAKNGSGSVVTRGAVLLEVDGVLVGDTDADQEGWGTYKFEMPISFAHYLACTWPLKLSAGAHTVKVLGTVLGGTSWNMTGDAACLTFLGFPRTSVTIVGGVTAVEPTP